MAQHASQGLHRPLAQQMEYWARLGAALDAAGISAGVAMQLLGNGAKADEFVSAALGKEVALSVDLPILKRRQRKDATEVAAGARSPSSLLVMGKGDLQGAQLSPNKSSEFERVADGW